MRVLTLAVTPANSTTIWDTAYFYTGSATETSTVGNLSHHDCAGRTSHRERSGLTTTRGCLVGFVRKKAHAGEVFKREESSQRAPLFCGWWEYKLDLNLNKFFFYARLDRRSDYRF